MRWVQILLHVSDDGVLSTPDEDFRFDWRMHVNQPLYFCVIEFLTQPIEFVKEAKRRLCFQGWESFRAENESKFRVIVRPDDVRFFLLTIPILYC